MKQKHLVAFLKTAEAFAECSHSKRLKVGAVAVKDGNIIGVGYNGMPSGMHNGCEGEDGNTLPEVIHAEQNALNKILKSNNSSVGCEMIITHSPCLQCAIKMVDAGVGKVYYENEYRNTDGIDWLVKNNIEVERINEL